IVARARAGERTALASLVERHSRRVFRVCMAVTADRDAAEDCLQKTFLLALDRLEQFRGQAQFSTWLTRIALNVSIAYRRERARHSFASLDAEEPIDVAASSETPEDTYYRCELRTALERSMKALSPLLRVVLVLRDVEDLSTEETARSLGISVAAVKTRLLRARMRMRELLAPRLRR
ncbi:MAG: RNA polymerase sigma factor, partial [Burkholderiales bacterium]